MGILREPKIWRRERLATATRRSSDLSPDEQENVRKALRFLALRLGGWAPLAEAMGANANTVWRSAHKGRVSAGTALRAARVAGVALEKILSGDFPVADICPYCGK